MQLHVFKGTDTHTHEAMLHIYASWGQKARLLVKENGMIAGVILHVEFQYLRHFYKMENFYKRRNTCKKRRHSVYSGRKSAIYLTAERRLALNIMQRMSGIAAQTNKMTELIKDTNCKLLDTRKTTPNFRIFEKEAVKIRGGLKQQSGKDISVGSRSLIIQLLNSNLIDEFQICIHPVIEGKGLKLFDQVRDRIMLKLIKTKTVKPGLTVLYYEPTRHEAPKK